MKKILLFTALLSIGVASAQNVYNYGFSGTTADLTTAGWVRTNQSAPSTATLWSVASYAPVVVNSSANPAVRSLPFSDVEYANGVTCPAPNGQAGGTNSFALVNYTSTSGAGTISNWLISPLVNTVQNGDIVSFYTRLGKIPGSSGAGFPDRLELRMSTSGAFSTNPSTGATDVGSFTVLLTAVNPTLITGVYPQVWTQYSGTVSGLAGPTSVKFGFRYFVTDGGPSGNNSDIIGIDTFSVDRPVASTESFFKNNFTVYPNPADNFLNVNVKNGVTVNEVALTDLNGRIVKTISSSFDSNLEINVSDLSAGVYMLTIKTNEGVGNSKFVKK